MQIKDVSGISFSARKSSQKQRHLPIGNCLLAKIVLDDESVLAVSRRISECHSRSMAPETAREQPRRQPHDQDGVYLSASWSFRVLKILETVKIF